MILNGAIYVSSSGASCAPGKGKGARLRCDLGSLAAGATRTVTVVAKAPTKPATVSATTTDPATADNADTESTGVVR